MVEQYLHHLYVRHFEPSERDENGDFLPGSAFWTFHTKCREETNGKGSVIWTADQRAYTFASLIQMPVGTTRIPEGTTVLVSSRELATSDLETIWRQLQDIDERKLFDSGDYRMMVEDGTEISPVALRTIVRIYGECAKFDPGQLHCRLWL